MGRIRRLMSGRLLVVGLCVAAFFLVIESLIHVFVFREGDLVGQMFFADAREIALRVLVVLIVIAFAAFGQITLNQRRRAQEDLQTSQEMYRSLVEDINEVIYEVGIDGAIQYMSPSVEAMLGFSAPELVGSPFTGLLHQDDLGLVADRFQQSVSGHPQPTECRLLTRNGDFRWVHGSSKPILAGGQMTGIRGVLVDITERKQAEEELREIERLFRGITENVTDVIWTMDMNLNFTHVSPSTERLIGYTPEEEMAIGLAGIMTPESLEVASKAYERALDGESTADQMKTFSSITADLDHIHKDGHIVPTEVRMGFLR
ncbi:MAG: PAS domain S-box protein, partial [Dehalococcoidia bacterium]